MALKPNKYPNIHTDTVQNGIVYNDTLMSYIKYRDGKKVGHIDIEINKLGSSDTAAGFTVREIMAIGYHQHHLNNKRPKQYEVVIHRRTGHRYFIETEGDGEYLGGNCGDPLVMYRQIDPPHQAYVHLKREFDKINDDGTPRFERTGEHLSKSRVRAILAKARWYLEKHLHKNEGDINE